MRLGVSPAAASTPAGVFNQWFEALFTGTGALGCKVCLTPQLFLLVYPYANVGPPAPPAATLLQVLSTWLPISSPPTGLEECFFFISLVVGLPYSLIFCQFWLFFVFKFVVVLLLVVQEGKVYLPTPPSWLEIWLLEYYGLYSLWLLCFSFDLSQNVLTLGEVFSDHF